MRTVDLFEMKSNRKSALRWYFDQSQVIRNIFKLPNRNPDTFAAKSVQYYSDSGIDQLVRFVTVLLGLGLLFAPRWYLHFVEDFVNMLGVIAGFVALFAFWLWAGTGAPPYEILLGTAAYAAILSIYLEAAKGGRTMKTEMT